MSKKKKHLGSELETLHYSILEDWVDKGRTEELPEEMARYLEQLNFVSGLWNTCHTPRKIISKLILTYPALDGITAKSRMEDAFTWFYLDDKLKQDTWRNMIFEKQLKIADAAILSAKTVDDYNKASVILQRAYKAKRLDEDELDVIPEHAFNKPVKIYSLDTSDFIDLPQDTNRNLLANYIDSMNVTEDEKLKFKQEGGIEPKELFMDYEPEED